MTRAELRTAMTIMADRTNVAGEVAEQLGISISTLYVTSMTKGKQNHAPANCLAADHQMRVSFLTAEQEHRYSDYAGKPSTDQLAQHFHLGSGLISSVRR